MSWADHIGTPSTGARMTLRPRHFLGAILLSLAVAAGGVPAVAAPTAAPTVDTDVTVPAPADEDPPPRDCDEELAPNHEGEATYFDDVLENPSCSGVPMERITGEKCIDGMAGIFPCDNVALKSFLPLSEMDAVWSNDIWGWTDPLDGREFALIGLDNGTGFVDVTRPRNPVYLGTLPTHTVTSTWRDIKVVKNHAFVVSEAAGHGMQVFDLKRLRGVTEPQRFTEDAWLGGFGQAHNIAANEATNFVYVVGSTQSVTACGADGNGGGGPIMVKVKRPKNPRVVGCVPEDGYTHDTQCVVYAGPDTEHVGREICMSANEDTITVVDVTDKANPVQLDRVPYSTSAYSHQAWLTPNQKFLLANDELDEVNGEVPSTTTYIWDVQDLDDIALTGDFQHGTESIDHNLYIKKKFAFESNYMSGVRILGTRKVGEGILTARGFFDLYPSEDAVNFAGTWSNYPYFESGIVIATGMEEGLFVLRPTGKIGAALRR
jgi:choice-of-anchor B domain-containing protein